MNNSEFNRYKEVIEKHIYDFLPEVDHKSETLYDAMKYSLKAGGKRLRPVLLLAACEFAGGKIENAIPYACAIEYIHTYSLIHDDLPAMDDDSLRRGQPTNHIAFGEAMAILAGDGLLSSAFEIMNKDMFLYFDDAPNLKRRVRACYDIAKGSGCRGMIAGQVADMEAENKQCSKELIDYIHINKTGALIVAAVRAGAHLAGASDEMLAKLTTYAENIGLSFQIVDDLLDVYGDEKEIGKKVGVDTERNKSTYPCVYGLEESKVRLKDLTDTALSIMEPYYDEAELFNYITLELANKWR